MTSLISKIGGAIFTASAAAMTLAGCTSVSPDYLEYRSRSDPVSVTRRIADNIGRCWFADGETAFAGHAYVPERNAATSRVLILRKDQPGGLPRLIIDASRDGRRTSVKLFGPMLDTPLGPRIRADVNRWAGGTSGCA
ncbi:MAG: hypothetical protein ACTSSQ_04040 [Alphaproteobacteria bacterium]